MTILILVKGLENLENFFVSNWLIKHLTLQGVEVLRDLSFKVMLLHFNNAIRSSIKGLESSFITPPITGLLCSFRRKTG